MTVSGGYSAVAESNELKPKVVRAVITGYMEWWCHDRFWWLFCCCREQRVETESGKGRYHFLHGIGCQRTQEEWFVQDCWRLKHEVEEEACPPSPQRCQSVHQ